MIKFVVTLLTLSCCAYYAHSLSCYTCYNTIVNNLNQQISNCNDPFNKTNILVLDCGAAYPNFKNFKCYKYQNGKNSSTAVSRGCAPYNGTFSEKDTCSHSNFTTCSFCSSDKCNSAPVNEVVGIFSLFMYAVLYFTK